MQNQTDFSLKPLSGNLEEDITRFKEIFAHQALFRIRELCCPNFKAAVIFFDGVADSQMISESIIKPLLLFKAQKNDLLQSVYKSGIFSDEAALAQSSEEIVKAIMYGDTALLLCGGAIILNTKGFCTRSIEEPKEERVLQGPREGFCESVLKNLSLILRRLTTPNLHLKKMTVGRTSATSVFVCYLDNIVNKKVLGELYRRLEKIDIDGVLDSNYLCEMIKDHPHSLFKTVGATERPDIIAARLLEGRVAIFVDGTPVVLTVPYLFCENFQSNDDYYLNYMLSSFSRVLRYVCFAISVLVPALYLALVNYYPQLLPSFFLITISGARQSMPFSSFLECLLLIFVFHILKEAGIRMPESMGHALSIVGGLVVGQAAVEAKIISAPMLIVVALSGICGLVVSRLKNAILYLRIIYALAGAALGLLGLFLAVTLTAAVIFNMSSFLVDYTVYLRAPSPQGLKDTLVRAPWNKMLTRPLGLSKNRIREKEYEG